jgi:KDO2-lipid IV(A) lauroyltransferase
LQPITHRFATKESYLLDQNIDHILHLPAESTFAKIFKEQVIRHQLTTVFEAIKGVARPNTIQVEGLEELRSKMEQIESQDHGQILFTAHLGCWEFVALFAARFTDKKFFALAKPVNSQFLTDALAINRSKMGISVLWTDKSNLLKSMIRCMKAKDWLSFVMDQKPQGRQGPEVDFYDKKIAFVGGPAQMSIRNNAPIIGVFCLRCGPMHYRIISEVIVPAEHNIVDQQELTQKMASVIEKYIKLYPEQWCWNYKRWVHSNQDHNHYRSIKT